MNQRIDAMPVDDASNRQARQETYRRISWPLNLAPPRIDYVSAGHALILGDERAVRRAARDLADAGLASLSLLFTAPVPADSDDAEDAALLAATAALSSHAVTREQAGQLRLSGYLGGFTLALATPEGPLNLGQALTGREHVDLVLDLNETPLLTLELPPPGYLALPASAADRAEQLASFAALVGDFDKPRYVEIDTARCAHSRSGYGGCTRCLEVCPADAIASRQGRINAWIELDPFRCHGVGSCASACPTGAIDFRQPAPQRQLDTVLGWLAAYREAGGTVPVVRFIEAETLAAEDDAAGHLLDVPLAEIGAAGHDQWLACLAGGAAEVRVQCPSTLPARLSTFIDEQLAQGRALLEALALDPDRLVRLAGGESRRRDALPAQLPLTTAPLTFTSDDKRERLNQTLSRLAALGRLDGARHALPAGTALGTLQVDTHACTLCMACVAGCPTPALGAGEQAPRLDFREADCVQCGLCAEACPEQAISLVPGFLAAPEREQRRVLHEEAAFACIACGKPFASAATLAAIKARLADHPAFAGEAARRLEMCEDCRVRDAWRAMARDPASQLKV